MLPDMTEDFTMKSLFALRKPTVLEGAVCTVTLRMLPTPGTADIAPLSAALKSVEAKLEADFREAVVTALGPTFSIHAFNFREPTGEILIAIQSTPHVVHDYRALTRALRKLVSCFRDLLSWRLAEQSTRFRVSGKWIAAPAMIRVQLDKSTQSKSFSDRLQQPLTLLLIATLLGSVLIPYFNNLSNRAKLRQEERVKLAISILDQTKETDVRMDDMMRHFVLFRKEHHDTHATPEQLKSDQLAEMKVMKDSFYAYSSQAFWWPWNVWHKANLSALATPEESQKFGIIRDDYLKTLDQSSQSLGTLWKRLLEDPYKPDDHEIDQLIDRVQAEILKCRTLHDDQALKMAQIFAGS